MTHQTTNPEALETRSQSGPQGGALMTRSPKLYAASIRDLCAETRDAELEASENLQAVEAERARLAAQAQQEADLEAMENEVVHPQGWTRGQLRAAFETVQSPVHWKAPIRASLPSMEAYTITAAAVEFFTGSVLHIGGCPADGTVLVEADGYWEAVGA